MFMETPQTLIYITVGAFLLGWVVAKIGSRFAGGGKAHKRDPRDDRIRSLEAEHRVAKSDAASIKTELEERDKKLAEAQTAIEDREGIIKDKTEIISGLRKDLRESVKKTRELRSELSDRATENLKSEVKLREVETELSVAQASSDMIATGVLDYSMAPDGEEPDEEEDGDTKTAKAGS